MWLKPQNFQLLGNFRGSAYYYDSSYYWAADIGARNKGTNQQNSNISQPGAQIIITAAPPRNNAPGADNAFITGRWYYRIAAQGVPRGPAGNGAAYYP